MATETPSGMARPVPATGDALRCRACGFLAAEWHGRDLATVLDRVGRWWSLATAPAPQPPALASGTSAAAGLEAALDALAQSAPGTGADPLEQRLTVLGRALASVVSSTPGERPGRERAVGTRAVHELVHHCTAAARAQVAGGVGAPRARGRLAGVQVSDGGVPKHRVHEAAVGWRGVAGDRQADAARHGRPFQAVCLWSADAIAALVAEGHPIRSGAAGENLTVGDVDWVGLRPGTRVVAGSVELELSYPAVPCRAQARWFSDGDFRRIAHERHPERARWYAWVRRPGVVATGDPVLVEP